MRNDHTEKDRNKAITARQIVLLQLVVMLYTVSGIFAKFASGSEFLSLRFLLLYGGEILILGIYAILWQQIIKKVDLSVAYANRSVALIWSMTWAVLIFHETLKINQIIGVLVVIAGTILVNSDHD